MSNIDLYIRDKDSNVIRKIGDDRHDMQLWGDERDRIYWKKFYSQLEEFMKTKEVQNERIY